MEETRRGWVAGEGGASGEQAVAYYVPGRITLPSLPGFLDARPPAHGYYRGELLLWKQESPVPWCLEHELGTPKPSFPGHSRDKANLGALTGIKAGEPVWADSLGVRPSSSGRFQTAPRAPLLQGPLLLGPPPSVWALGPLGPGFWIPGEQLGRNPPRLALDESKAVHMLSATPAVALDTPCVIFGRPPLVLSHEMPLTTGCWRLKSGYPRISPCWGPRVLEALPNLPLWTSNGLG